MGLFRWNGMLADAGHLPRMLVGLVAVVLATSFTFMELGFVGVPLPGGKTAYLVMQLLPVAGAALLLGTLGGAINGLVTGAIMYLHSLVMPLNLHELALITPLSSIGLLGLCGLLSGLLFALSLRLIEQAVRAQVTLVYTASTLKDVFYIIPRRMRAKALAEGHDVEGVSFTPLAWACVETMSEIAVAVGQSLPECSLAWMLRNEHPDLEDNLIFAAAETSNVDFVVTYDRQMLEHFAPACITPTQALHLLELGTGAR